MTPEQVTIWLSHWDGARGLMEPMPKTTQEAVEKLHSLAYDCIKTIEKIKAEHEDDGFKQLEVREFRYVE